MSMYLGNELVTGTKIRKDTVIVRNDGGYFGTIPSEVITGELPSAQPEKVCIAKITLSEEQVREAVEKAKSEIVQVLPSAQPEWNNHTVACLLAELFDDTCACNYNGIDEWLPEKCEVIDACPNPAGVACWEQFLTHRAERRTDD